MVVVIVLVVRRVVDNVRSSQAIIFDSKSIELNEDAFNIFQPYTDATDKVTGSSPESKFYPCHIGHGVRLRFERNVEEPKHGIMMM